MLGTARATLVDAVPGLARFIGGFYPNLPVHLWEFHLRRNRESLVVWQSDETTVSCKQHAGEWTVALSSPDFEREEASEDFNDALTTAYRFICLASTDSDLEPPASFHPET